MWTRRRFNPNTRVEQVPLTRKEIRGVLRALGVVAVGAFSAWLFDRVPPPADRARPRNRLLEGNWKPCVKKW